MAIAARVSVTSVATALWDNTSGTTTVKVKVYVYSGEPSIFLGGANTVTTANGYGMHQMRTGDQAKEECVALAAGEKLWGIVESGTAHAHVLQVDVAELGFAPA